MNEMKPILERWLLVKYTLDQLVFIYPTLGFPIITWFPSHEWNEIHPLTMTTGQLYYFEIFHFLKGEC